MGCGVARAASFYLHLRRRELVNTLSSAVRGAGAGEMVHGRGYKAPSGMTKVRLDFLDYRSGEDPEVPLCFRSYPKTKRFTDQFDTKLIGNCLASKYPGSRRRG